MNKGTETTSKWIAASEPEQHRPNFLVAAALLSMAVIAMSFELTWQVGVLSVYILGVCFTFTALPRIHLQTAAISWVVAGLVLAYAGYGSQYWYGIRSNNGEIISNMHTIELALEHYAYDHGGYYPDSIAALLSDSAEYMRVLPPNPFEPGDAEASETALDAPGRMHPLGEVDIPRNPAKLIGHFLYIPVFVKVDGEMKAVDYTLIGYNKYAPNIFRAVLLNENTAVPCYYRASKYQAAELPQSGTDAP